MTEHPHLIAVAHGTKNVDGVAELRRLTNLVRTALPEVRVELCFVDVIDPRLPEMLDRLPGPCVVVPLLLATGYHVKTDIPEAVTGRADVVVTAPIGPDEKVSRAVQHRLEQARATGAGDVAEPVGEDDVIVMSAGSSDPEARHQLAQVAVHLGQWNTHAVSFGQITNDTAPIASASPTVQVANYLLAPGYFNDLLQRDALGLVVGRPIGAHPLVAEVIVDRYRAALS